MMFAATVPPTLVGHRSHARYAALRRAIARGRLAGVGLKIEGGALIVSAVLSLMPARTLAAPPARTLCVEWREAGADAGGGWQVGTADGRGARAQAPQRLCMQNGEGASMNLGVTRPVQVWQMAPGVLLPVLLPSTQWIAAGQSVTLRARWDGGRAPVQLDIDARRSAFDPSVAPGSSEAPSRTQADVKTTLRVPLDTWVTIASAGADAGSGNVVSTQQARGSQRLQVRVELGP